MCNSTNALDNLWAFIFQESNLFLLACNMPSRIVVYMLPILLEFLH